MNLTMKVSCWTWQALIDFNLHWLIQDQQPALNLNPMPEPKLANDKLNLPGIIEMPNLRPDVVGMGLHPFLKCVNGNPIHFCQFANGIWLDLNPWRIHTPLCLVQLHNQKKKRLKDKTLVTDPSLQKARSIFLTPFFTWNYVYPIFRLAILINQDWFSPSLTNFNLLSGSLAYQKWFSPVVW